MYALFIIYINIRFALASLGLETPLGSRIDSKNITDVLTDLCKLDEKINSRITKKKRKNPDAI